MYDFDEEEVLFQWGWDRAEQARASQIINLTQHQASLDQFQAGVRDWHQPDKLRALLDFQTLPVAADVRHRAVKLAELAKASGCKTAMIGGAPFLMSALERALLEEGITPVYAFSVRDSAEETLPDGSVRKINTFRHAGFVAAV